MDKQDKEVFMYIAPATINGGTVNNGNWNREGEWLEVPTSPEGYKRDAFKLTSRPETIAQLMQSKGPGKSAFLQLILDQTETSEDMTSRLNGLASKPVIVQVLEFTRDEDHPVKLNTYRSTYWAQLQSVQGGMVMLEVYVAREIESQRTKDGGRTQIPSAADFGNQHAVTRTAHGRAANVLAEDPPDTNVNVEEYGGLLSF